VLFCPWGKTLPTLTKGIRIRLRRPPQSGRTCHAHPAHELNETHATRHRLPGNCRFNGGLQAADATSRDQAARLNTDLDKARNATESTWDDVKAGFRTGYGELKDGFNQARQWVGDKIAP
jgi:hypothetical protein